ncbi:MAG: hypothetical protein K2O52_07390 [Oscillospiraceae bacterium]|nr:hypothetical protein [Oscillospiraceae bacterium]
MERITTGKEKQKAYRVEYSRYKKALAQEFYLEGLVIGYAIIEDRLVSFLHYCGIVSRNRNKLAINKSIYPFIRILLNKSEDASIKVKDIRVKMNIVQALLELTPESAQQIENDTETIINRQNIGKKRKKRILTGYMVALQKKMDTLNRPELLSFLNDQLEPWRINRNNIVHALLSKRVESVTDVKKELSEMGYELTRVLDNNLVKPTKKGTDIRKKFNIQ